MLTDPAICSAGVPEAAAWNARPARRRWATSSISCWNASRIPRLEPNPAYAVGFYDLRLRGDGLDGGGGISRARRAAAGRLEDVSAGIQQPAAGRG